MDSGHSKARMNVEGDRLSSLPDDLIHKILSFTDIKHAVQTSVLASRWRFIWPSMPYLNFSNEDFHTIHDFSTFVTRVLSCRNNEIELSSVKLSFREMVNEVLLKRILDYAFSHNVQQLTVSCLIDKKVKLPLHLFRSQSLKYLRLIGYIDEFHLTLASTWELPALTTLHLDNVTFYEDNTDKGIGLFSKCKNLKNLTITKFTMKRSNVFTICHPRLSNLTRRDGHSDLDLVNVVAPQLENLCMVNCYGEHRISAPVLASLFFESFHFLRFSTDDLLSLQKVDLRIDNSLYKWDGCTIAGLLQQFHNVRFLTLNSELVEGFSRYLELIPLQSSPFGNLKSLKIHPLSIFSNEQPQSLSAKVKNYLLHASPCATFTMIPRKGLTVTYGGTSLKIEE